jgi:hypothetical protein
MASLAIKSAKEVGAVVAALAHWSSCSPFGGIITRRRFRDFHVFSFP